MVTKPLPSNVYLMVGLKNKGVACVDNLPSVLVKYDYRLESIVGTHE